MPVQTGTATPWNEIEGPSQGGSSVVYFRPGLVIGNADLLAEQMRADGVVPSLGPGIGAASRAELQTSWYGTNDDGEFELCDAEGWTPGGTLLADPATCVLALVDLTEPS